MDLRELEWCAWRDLNGSTALTTGPQLPHPCLVVPQAGIEPASPASEAGGLSVSLLGQEADALSG